MKKFGPYLVAALVYLFAFFAVKFAFGMVAGSVGAMVKTLTFAIALGGLAILGAVGMKLASSRKR